MKLLCTFLLFLSPLVAQAPSEMRDPIERYLADRGALTRFYTIETSPKRRAKFDSLASQYLSDIAKMNFDGFGQEGKVDYILFKNYLERELRESQLRTKAYSEVSPLVPFAPTITDLEEARRNLDTLDSAKA